MTVYKRFLWNKSRKPVLHTNKFEFAEVDTLFHKSYSIRKNYFLKEKKEMRIR